VRIAVAAGDAELAEHTIEQAEQRCELNPGVVSFKAAVAHARGLWRSSTCHLETAASLFETGPRPLATASALEDLGRLQASEGATDDAIASLDRALAINAQVGAGWDAARVRRRLRQLGCTAADCHFGAAGHRLGGSDQRGSGHRPARLGRQNQP